MNELTPLTSKSGESEWPYKKKTVIAIPETDMCNGCIAMVDNEDKSLNNCKKLPDCTTNFHGWVIFIEKPAEK
jgi:hypothetical protein